MENGIRWYTNSQGYSIVQLHGMFWMGSLDICLDTLWGVVEVRTTFTNENDAKLKVSERNNL